MEQEKTVAILTALDLEYKAVREHLSSLRTYTHEKGTRWEVGVVPDGSCRIAIGDTGVGNLSSAVLAARAIEELEPLALLFVGVAGTPKDDISLGDVVVATHVYAYHGGASEDDQFRARPRVWEAPHRLVQLAGEIARHGDWKALLGKPGGTVHRAPVAAGEAVLKSRTSTEADRIRAHYNDAAAVEMEGAGVAQAAQLSGFPAMLIRGISDYANADKRAADQEGWQPIAAKRAAAFAITLASRLAAETHVQGATTVRAAGRGRHAAADVPAAVAPTFNNLAHGNSQVGIQAGQIFGGAYVGHSDSGRSLDIERELKNLRLALEEAYRAGRIDAETHESAQTELTTATEASPTGDEKPTTRFTNALKRLKGMLEDVADFGVKITTILTNLGRLR